jgi:membrane protein
MSRHRDQRIEADAPVETPGETPKASDQRPAASPATLPKNSWIKVIKGAGQEFSDDNLADTAAALTYYSIQALFPAALVLVSLVGFLNPDTTTKLIANLGAVIPGSAKGTIVDTINTLQDSGSHTAGVAFVAGLLAALWSASGYIAAFMRASNIVFDVPEGRPIWKTLPTRVLTTLVLLLLMIVAAVIVVFTGSLAEQAGNLLGLGQAAVTVWDIAKWPVLVVLMMVMVGILYWAAPNAKQGFKWVTPGGVIGVLIWIVASALFAFYVANFSSYNKTYGAFAGVIVFLVWTWISNVAILLGLEINAELARARAENDGLPVGAEPYIELRDTRTLDDDERAEVEGSRLHRQPDRGGDSGSI